MIDVFLMEFNHCHLDKKYGQRNNSRIVQIIIYYINIVQVTVVLILNIPFMSIDDS